MFNRKENRRLVPVGLKYARGAPIGHGLIGIFTYSVLDDSDQRLRKILVTSLICLSLHKIAVLGEDG